MTDSDAPLALRPPRAKPWRAQRESILAVDG